MTGIKPKGSLLAAQPGQMVAIDMVGPLKRFGKEYTLLTMIDHYSKFAEVAIRQWDAICGGQFPSRLRVFGC